MTARLIILNPTSDAVCLDENERSPQVPLPRYQAETAGIVQSAKEQLGLDIAVLVCLQYKRGKESVYLCGALDGPQSPHCWQPLGSLPKADSASLNNWLANPSPLRAPWTNIQWHRDVRQ